MSKRNFFLLTINCPLTILSFPFPSLPFFVRWLTGMTEWWLAGKLPFFCFITCDSKSMFTAVWNAYYCYCYCYYYCKIFNTEF